LHRSEPRVAINAAKDASGLRKFRLLDEKLREPEPRLRIVARDRLDRLDAAARGSPYQVERHGQEMYICAGDYAEFVYGGRKLPLPQKHVRQSPVNVPVI